MVLNNSLPCTISCMVIRYLTVFQGFLSKDVMSTVSKINLNVKEIPNTGKWRGWYQIVISVY